LGLAPYEISLRPVTTALFSSLPVPTHVRETPHPSCTISQKVAAKTSPEVVKAAKASPRALRRLRTACEKAKRTLSTAASAPLEVDNFQPDMDVNLVSRTPDRMRD